MKQLFILCVIFCSGCDFPPDEATNIQQQLQAQISKGQVYLNHSSDELSYVIKNSEFTKLPEKGKEKLVSSVEKEMLEILSKYKNFKTIKIYFLGDGTTGIDRPYICNLTFNACTRFNEQGEQ